MAGSGVQTLSVSQSSPAFSRAGSAPPKRPGWGGGRPNVSAVRIPDQLRAGRGAANRSAPTGGSAYGMPRNTASPASCRPRTMPAVVRTSGSRCEPDGGVVAVTGTAMISDGRAGSAVVTARVRGSSLGHHGRGDLFATHALPAGQARRSGAWRRGEAAGAPAAMLRSAVTTAGRAVRSATTTTVLSVSRLPLSHPWPAAPRDCRQGHVRSSPHGGPDCVAPPARAEHCRYLLI